MYLSKLQLHHFMSYSGSDPYEFEFGPACNYLVGNNNCGKSTIFFALELLSNKGAKIPSYAPVSCTASEGYVGAIFSAGSAGDFPAQLKKYVYQDSAGHFTVQVKRGFKLSGGNATIEKSVAYDNTTGKFDNVVPDAVFGGLISPTCIDALIEPGDFADFGFTKLLGKILGMQSASIDALALWKEYQDAHERLTTDPSGIPSVLESIQKDLNDSLASLLDGVTARFVFSPQEVRDFLKSGTVFVDDGNQETELGSKGSGLQKAFAIAVIQAYAKHVAKHASSKLDLCIDEPETWLHPAAQIQFGEAISKIAASQQVWIATHSPYIIQSYSATRDDRLLIFSEQNAAPRYKLADKLNPHTGKRPSLAQISYEAFGLYTPEYHCELLGYIQVKSKKKSLKDLEEYLTKLASSLGGIAKRTRCKVDGGGKACESEELLPIYIRNCIHHPEAAGKITKEMRQKNVDNEFTQEELGESIRFLSKLISANRW